MTAAAGASHFLPSLPPSLSSIHDVNGVLKRALRDVSIIPAQFLEMMEAVMSAFLRCPSGAGPKAAGPVKLTITTPLQWSTTGSGGWS